MNDPWKYLNPSPPLLPPHLFIYKCYEVKSFAKYMLLKVSEDRGSYVITFFFINVLFTDQKMTLQINIVRQWILLVALQWLLGGFWGDQEVECLEFVQRGSHYLAHCTWCILNCFSEDAYFIFVYFIHNMYSCVTLFSVYTVVSW